MDSGVSMLPLFYVNYHTVDRIRTRALGDLSDPKARMVPLYHGGSLLIFNYTIVLLANRTTSPCS
ncbi:hypothetical protein E2C01_102581 [Portunus trituberculatus]|uniref:Uncharacterized protein n=1 Tax=Portunus trituberculatus TaxID=210409 RepID=A0A5B7KIP2_PORTR|nr:hypothetical protein [Portunus trituberculatus]